LRGAQKASLEVIPEHCKSLKYLLAEIPYGPVPYIKIQYNERVRENAAKELSIILVVDSTSLKSHVRWLHHNIIAFPLQVHT
jgi:hypothetical protein